MSQSDDLYYGVGVNGLTFQSEVQATRLVQKLIEHPQFCRWCLVPLKPDSPADDVYLSTVGTYDLYANPTEDVPPNRFNEHGELVEAAREKRRICDCGVIDLAPGDSRNKQTIYQALQHVCTLLEDNGATVDRCAAKDSVEEMFQKGHTGQFEKLIGKAIYEATG